MTQEKEAVVKKGLSEMTRKDFEAVPGPADYGKDITGFDSLVIMPTKRLHDSGYRAMYFIACKGDEPLVKLGGGSDVVHIDGIGGYGYKWLERFSGCPQVVPPTGWSIDCLKTSGFLRLFTHRNLIADAGGYSSFEIYSDPQKNKP